MKFIKNYKSMLILLGFIIAGAMVGLILGEGAAVVKPLVDLFLNRVRKEWQALGLLDKSHCTDDGYYEDKLLVIKPSELKDEYKTPDFQLFYATTGFGCDPQKTGRKVIGYFFKDNERAEFYRTDFIGVLKLCKALHNLSYG